MKNAIVIILLLSLFGCKKDKSAQQELKDDIKGNWTLTSIRTVYTDDKNTVLFESTSNVGGTLNITNNDLRLTLSGTQSQASYSTAVSGDDRILLINGNSDYLAFKSNGGIRITGDFKKNMTWESTLYNVTYVDANTNQQRQAAQVKIWHSFKR